MMIDAKLLVVQLNAARVWPQPCASVALLRREPGRAGGGRMRPDRANPLRL
jgi:hypothetical protein